MRTGSHGATDLSPVCLAAALHFDLSVHNFGIQEYMPHSDETDRVFPHAYSFADGTMHPGDAPGLGVDIDEALAATFPVSARLSARRASHGRHDPRLVDSDHEPASPPALPSVAILAAPSWRRRAVRAETGARSLAPLRAARRPGAARRLSPGGLTAIVVPLATPTGEVIAARIGARTRRSPRRRAPRVDRPRVGGAIVVGTPAVALDCRARLDRRRSRGSATRATSSARRPSAAIPATVDRVEGRERASLYGAFHLLRLLQTGQPLDARRRRRAPAAGAAPAESLGQPRRQHRARLRRALVLVAGSRRRAVSRDYARANASIGINGTVINSVNANPQSLTAPFLEKAAAIAAMLRPYRIRVYLAANFAAPRMIGGPGDQRSARPGRRALVARQGGRDLPR